MWAVTAKPFIKSHFLKHTLPLLLMANQTSLSFSSGSPVHAPLKRVGTHNGSFHCDEALGCFMIRLTQKFKQRRNRDHIVLEGLDAVLDVGGVYDPARDRYDHHQKGFEEVFGHGFSTKLSSAGLVYKHFGKEIIAKELKVDEVHQDVHHIYLAVYKSFMEVIYF
ncbi:MYG1 exonuclease-like [Vigna umbellata]|uniref:MYG1 exonuclease-like n=1 Tax=Vigna umbellata TaxID=87088 RepID=UPI001F5FC4AE|nr:MYG1 exonuclease-like [Vigna umbellata]